MIDLYMDAELGEKTQSRCEGKVQSLDGAELDVENHLFPQPEHLLVET